MKCCKNIGSASFKSCEEETTHWYIHKYSKLDFAICSFCNEHNYLCGDEISKDVAEYLSELKEVTRFSLEHSDIDKVKSWVKEHNISKHKKKNPYSGAIGGSNILCVYSYFYRSYNGC